MSKNIFISYSHGDMAELNWLDRLTMYLAPVGREGKIDIWDDRRISPGRNWKEDIDRALAAADAAILLVGPGFLASDFIIRHELPTLLNSPRARGIALYPLVIGYCGYTDSELKLFQAANSPDEPLESLSRAEQNRILNQLATSILRSLQNSENPAQSVGAGEPIPHSLVVATQRDLADAYTAFKAQCERRNGLVKMIEKRLDFTNDLEYEKFFFRYYSQLNEEERFEFAQIRAMTEGIIHPANRRALQAIDSAPAMLRIDPRMPALRQHLVFWLNKFDRVFEANRAMCLLYTGVEDGVPFPSGIDDALRSWIENKKP